MTEYALDVVEGRIVAGPGIRAATARHLRDIADPQWRVWQPVLFERFEKFCFAFCTVIDHEEGMPVPFRLQPSQQFVLGSILGWTVGEGDPLRRVPGTRRFRTAYLESGKGLGKTPMGAALALYMIWADATPKMAHEPAAEGYIIAATEDQALISFRDIEAFIERSPELKQYFKVYGGTTKGRVVCEDTSSFLQTLGSHHQGIGRSGYRPHVIIVDEFHEHTTRDMLDMMDQGKKGRRQPLTFIMTNAGITPLGPCWDERGRALAVSDGMIDDDATFGAVFCLDEDDNPWKDEACWGKANPTLGHVIRADYLLGQMESAKGIPDKRRMVERLNFARWSGDAEEQFMPTEDWRRAEEEPGAPPDEPGAVTLGIDLAERDDLVAIAAVWNDGPFRVRGRVDYYTPADTLGARDERSSGHLRQWAEEGLIHTHPGSVVDFDFLADVIIEQAGRVNAVAIDPYKMNELLLAFERVGFHTHKVEKQTQHGGRGLPFWPHPQIYARKGDNVGLWMPGSINTLRDMLFGAETERHLRIQPNPVLRWNLISAILASDPQGNRRFDKRKSTASTRGKIDGLVALAMAVGLHEHIASGQAQTPLAKYYAQNRDSASVMGV